MSSTLSISMVQNLTITEFFYFLHISHVDKSEEYTIMGIIPKVFFYFYRKGRENCILMIFIASLIFKLGSDIISL